MWATSLRQFQFTEPYRLADLIVDYMTLTVTVAGQAVNLTPTKYKLLSELAPAPAATSATSSCSKVSGGQGINGDVQRVRTCIMSLRAKLGDDARKPTYILTVPNVGYRAAIP